VSPAGYQGVVDTEPERADPAGTSPEAQDRADREAAAPPLPDDPRVPRPEDADPSRSQDLGGAAPSVGPGAG
jgi:hypothetical protein